MEAFAEAIRKHFKDFTALSGSEFQAVFGFVRCGYFLRVIRFDHFLRAIVYDFRHSSGLHDGTMHAEESKALRVLKVSR